MINIQSFRTDDQKIFFTSDLHYNHQKIIDFCGRPFKDVDEMNETLIKNWNSVVDMHDIVFNLGDLYWGNHSDLTDLLSQLHGRHYLIMGNHDYKRVKQNDKVWFQQIITQKYIKVDNQKIYLNHFPLLCFNGSTNGRNSVWQLFGHVHTSKYKNDGSDFERLKYLMPTQYDVGVDLNDFTPVSFHTVKTRIEEQIRRNINCTYWIKH